MVEPIAKGAAELARRATSLVKDDTSSVGFGVWYKEDAPGAFSVALDELSQFAAKRLWPVRTGKSGVPGAWAETLSTAAFGHGAVIVAAQTGEHHPGDRDELKPLTDEIDTPQTREQWLGVSRPNPSFLYGGTSGLELSIRFPASLDAFLRCDGLTLSSTVRMAAQAAADRDWPIVYLHAPTAPPLREAGDGTGYDHVIDTPRAGVWPPARTVGVRFAVASGASEIRKRSEFVDTICGHCSLIGAEVWLGDHRGDRRGGQWVCLVGHDSEKYEGRSDRADPHDRTPLLHGLPVTFVGPTRIGTTAELLTHFVEAQVPIASASVVSLEGLAFIYLLVGEPPMAPEIRHQGSARSIIDYVLKREVNLSKATDYRGMVGGLKPLRCNNETAPLVAWAAWRVPDRENALSALIATLNTAMTELLAERSPDGLDVSKVNIEYMVCRRLETGELRGRCKLALPARADKLWREPGSEGSRDALCDSVEQRWKNLASEKLEAETIEVEFSWQEWRLGRWYALLPAVGH
jgi:hypothetical protein